MTKITRYTGDLEAFASNPTGTERTIFGSVAASDELTANIDTADFKRGWGIVSASTPPSKQDFNALGYSTTFLHAYLHQMGIAEWDSLQQYFVGSATIATGNLYIAKTGTTGSPSIGNNPVTDSASWKLMAAMEDLEDAININYDNVASGLAAINVQEAIDELSLAANIVYDNAASGLTAVQLQAAIDEIVTLTTPAGAVQYFAMATAPTGWIKADGTAISRAAYSSLFSAIGTTYGAGDGSLTFNLPDLRGEFLRGYDDGRGVDTGRVLGSAQVDAMEQHSHYTGVVGQGAELSSYCAAGHISPDIFLKNRHTNGNESGSGPNGVTGGVLSSGATVTSALQNATASCKAASTETRARNIALNACIKT